MREDDLPRIFQYIGGIIREMNAIPMEIGGMKDHVHIFTSLPKTVALTDFVRDIKANSSRWMKQIDHYYSPFASMSLFRGLSPPSVILSPLWGFLRLPGFLQQLC